MLRLCLLSSFAVFLNAPSAMAGAWTKRLGETYTKVGSDFYKANRYVDPETGQAIDGLDFFGQQTSLYSEVGLLTSWPVQVSAQLPLVYGVATFGDAQYFAEDERARATFSVVDAFGSLPFAMLVAW